ncbi:MAG: PBP1A family penicillin-binding protein [Spirochaetes bacterium]|nr:PBP1A family penicillin-binding protein [Spirochaetota bacterium]
MKTIKEKLDQIFTLPNIEKVTLVSLSVYSLFLGLLLGFMVVSLQNLTGIKELEDYRPATVTKIYDNEGRLISEYFEEQREIVSLKEIPELLTKALVAVEDQKFYQHKGIHFQGIVRAFVVNMLAGYIKEGGSTITQQLSKILFTTRKKSIFRKLKEAWLAFQIEKLYTKEEIIEFYLNQVYFGHGAYGVEAASRFYFNKRVSDLNVAECALLAALPAAPNKYSPIKDPETSQQRHKKVLNHMVESGIIDEEQAQSDYYDFWINYQGKIVAPNSSFWKIRVDNAPHFTEHVRRIMEKRFGEKILYTEGMRIYTTLNLDMQKAAQETLWKRLQAHNNRYYTRIEQVNKNFDKNFADLISLMGLILDNKKIANLSTHKELNRFNYYFSKESLEQFDLASLIFGLDDIHRLFRIYRTTRSQKVVQDKVEGAIISIEPYSGYIKAMVGGSEFTPENQYNRAVQSYRQPGSAFKPFVYMAALDTGRFTPATTFTDSPVVYFDGEGKEWIPNNYTGQYYGLVTLRKALQKSINIISVMLADQVEIDNVRELAAKMLHIYDYHEMKKNLPDDLSLALGTATVTPLQMANAFAIIANKGRDVIPISIKYIKDRNNNVLVDMQKELARKPRRQIITPQVAFLITDMMKSVLKPGGTAWGAAIETDFWLPAAGKTGTTDNWRDAWFAGFTEKLASVVWVGFDNYSRSLGLGEEGGKVAAPIWCEYMKKAMRNYYLSDFEVPPGITKVDICLRSGKLVSNDCKERGVEYFIEGSEPSQECTSCKEGYKQFEFDEEKVEKILDEKRKKLKDKIFKDKFRLKL